jgi:hypothetical protein
MVPYLPEGEKDCHDKKQGNQEWQTTATKWPTFPPQQFLLVLCLLSCDVALGFML